MAVASGLIILIGLIIFFLPPTNLLNIFIFVMAVSLSVSLTIKHFINRKMAILGFFFSFILLSLQVFRLFDIVNIALGISLLGGLYIFLK